MSFKNIKILVNLDSKNTHEINVNLDNLEKGDTLNYLIGNVENYFKNNISFDKNNISLHKFKDINDKCLWSNDISKKDKLCENLEIEDDSIYCLKFKNIQDIEIPKFIKSGIDNNNDILNNLKNLKNFSLVNLKINYINDGIIKEGTFIKVNDRLHLSNGKITYLDVKIIEGEFDKKYFLFDMNINKDFLLEGKKIISNNYIEEGFFDNNKLLKGKITTSNYIYQGVFDRNSKLLYGKITDLNNKLIKKGIFNNGFLIKGKQIKDDDIHEGIYSYILDKFYMIQGKIIYKKKNIYKEGLFEENNDLVYGKINHISEKNSKSIFSNSLSLNKKKRKLDSYLNNYTQEGIFNNGLLLKGKIITSKYIYEGTFNTNSKLLYGKITDVNNNLIQEGTFNNGFLIKGIKFKNSKIYEGIFDKNNIVAGTITHIKTKFIEKGLFDKYDILINGKKYFENNLLDEDNEEDDFTEDDEDEDDFTEDDLTEILFGMNKFIS